MLLLVIVLIVLVWVALAFLAIRLAQACARQCANAWGELIGPVMEVYLVRPWQGPHREMAGVWLTAIKNCRQRLASTRFDVTVTLQERLRQK